MTSTSQADDPDAPDLPPVADPVPVSDDDAAPDCPACGQTMSPDDSGDTALAWVCECTGDGED